MMGIIRRRYRSREGIAHFLIYCASLILLPLICGEVDAAGYRVTGWGRNAEGQLNTPRGLTNAIAIAAGHLHGIALTDRGTVEAWGDNTFGQLNVPEGLSNVVAIAAGAFHNLAILQDGSVVGWGDNRFGQIKIPVLPVRVTAVVAGVTHSAALGEDRNLILWGSQGNGQLTPKGLKAGGVQSIVAGDFHNLVWTTNDTIVGWGLLGYGVNYLDLTTGFRSIAAGGNTCAVVLQDQTISVWGDRPFSVLQPPSGLGQVKSIHVGAEHILVLKTDGTVVAWAGSSQGESIVPPGLSSVHGLAAGRYFTLALVDEPTFIRQPSDHRNALVETTELQGEFSATDGLRYQWERNGVPIQGATGAVLRLPPIAGSLGDYRLRAEADSRTNWSRIARVASPPVFLRPPQSVAAFATSNATLHGEAAGYPALTYRWADLDQGKQYTGAADLVIPPRISGRFQLVVSNELGVVTSEVITLRRYDLPSVSILMDNKPLRPGDSFQIEAVAQGFNLPPFVLQWKRNESLLVSETNALLSVSKATVFDEGTYSITLNSPAGELSFTAGSITVVPERLVCWRGRELILDSLLQIQPGFLYQWTRDGIVLPRQNAPRITFDELQESDSGDYRLAVTDERGVMQNRRVASLEVKPAPDLGSLVLWGATNNIFLNPTDPTSVPFGMAPTDDVVAMGLHRDGYGVFLRSNGEVVPNAFRRQAPQFPKIPFEPAVGLSWKSGPSPWIHFRSGWLGMSSTRSVFGGLKDVTAFGEGQGFVVSVGYDSTPAFLPTGGYSPSVVPPQGLTGLVAVSAGVQHVVALKRDGTVVAWGDNSYQQTSVPPGLKGVRSIVCGPYYTLAVRSNGTVLAWGLNSSRQCDVPSDLGAVRFVRTSSTYAMALLSNGTIRGWGTVDYGQLNIPAGLDAVIDLNLTDYFVGALVGKRGRPTVLLHPTNKVVRVGESCRFLSKGWDDKGTVQYQWTFNGSPLPGATNASLFFPSIAQDHGGVYQVRISNSVGVSLSDAAELYVEPKPFLSRVQTPGRLVVWGGSKPVAYDCVDAPAVAVDSFPLSTSVAIYQSNGDIRICGYRGSVLLPAKDVVKVVFTEGESGWIYGLTKTGMLRVWAVSPYDFQTLVETNAPVGFRDLRQIEHDAGGVLWGLRNDGTVLRQDRFWDSVVVMHDVRQMARGVTGGLFLPKDPSSPCPEGGYPSIAQASLVWSNALDLVSGGSHWLALSSEGLVAAWGENQFGQCDVPSGLSNVVSIAAGTTYSMALTRSGQLHIWGRNDTGQAQPPTSLTQALALSAINGGGVALQSGPAFLTPLIDLEIPQNTSTNLSVRAEGRSPVHYQWYFEGAELVGETSPELSIVVTKETEGLYSVRAQTEDGVAWSDAMVSMALPPRILSLKGSHFVTKSQFFELQADIEGTLPFQHAWFYGTNALSESSPEKVRFYVYGARDPFEVTLVLINRYGAATSEVFRVEYLDPPTLNSEPTSQKVALGDTVELAVTTGGGGRQSFQWFHQGAVLSGATQNVLRLPSFQENQAGAYYVEVANPVGSVRSQEAILASVPDAIRILHIPGDTRVPFERPVSWTIDTEGAQPKQYQWFQNSLPIPGATSARYAITRAERRHEGEYHVEISNRAGKVVSASFQLQLQDPPSVIVWGPDSLARAVPPEATNVLSIAGLGHLLALRLDGTVVAWGTNQYGQCNVPADLSEVVMVAAGKFHSLALRKNGRVVGWGNSTNGEADPPSDLTDVTAISAGTSHSLALRSNGTVVGWGNNLFGKASPPAGLSNVMSIAAIDQQSAALLTNGNLIVWGESRKVPGSYPAATRLRGHSELHIFRKDGLLVSWIPTPFTDVKTTDQVADADSAYFSYRNGNSIWVANHRVMLLHNGTIRVESDDPNAYFAPPQDITNVTQVAAGNAFQAALIQGPWFAQHPMDQSLRPGDMLRLTGEGLGIGEIAHQWLLNGQAIPGATQPTLIIPSFQSSDAGTYQLRITDLHGSRLSQPALVTDLSLPPVITVQPKSQSHRVGDFFTLEVSVASPSPVSYAWYRNGELIPEATENKLRFSFFQPTQVGVYRIVARNATGSLQSGDAMVSLQTEDLILDNATAEVLGGWRPATNSYQVGTNYLVSGQSSPDGRVIFRTRVPRQGSYRIETHLPVTPFVSPNPEAFAAALHRIDVPEGSRVVLPSYAEWSSLGQYLLNPDDPVVVSVLDSLLQGSLLSAADAIRCVYLPDPPAILQTSPSVEGVEGGSADLHVDAAGSLPLGMRWEKDGLPLIHATLPSLRLDPLRIEDSGTYRLLVWNGDGFVRSPRIEVRVAPADLSFKWMSGTLTFQWSGARKLQTSTEVNGPYVDVPNATSPYAWDPEGVEIQRFYRLSP